MTSVASVGKPTTYLTAVRCAAGGNRDALDVVARWAYVELGRVLRRYGRRWPADDFEDAVQLAVCHVMERLGHCRAENDYQLRAWVAVIGWRAVLRDRLERRSIDARPGAAAQRDGRLATLHAPDDTPSRADASLDTRPFESVASLLVALEQGTGRSVNAVRSTAREASSCAASAADAHAGRPTDDDGAAPTVPTAACSLPGFVREHATLLYSVACRLAVDAYAELPDATQEMFWRRLVEGASWVSVAAHAGVTAAAAKRRLQRAEKTLARRFAAQVRALPAPAAAAVVAYCRRAGIDLPEPSPGRDAATSAAPRGARDARAQTRGRRR